jgi:hypothetical protein
MRSQKKTAEDAQAQAQEAQEKAPAPEEVGLDSISRSDEKIASALYFRLMKWYIVKTIMTTISPIAA